jgi:hypothetical protein
MVYPSFEIASCMLFWFVEKDRFEAAHLYSLSDFKSEKVRASENFESN